MAKHNMRGWDRFTAWTRHVLSCCSEEEDERPALQISAPTDFRREDITIEGLTDEQQQFIRQKAIADAHRMFAHLQPLASSPSGSFATRPPNFPTEQAFTTPRAAPVPSRLDRVKAHSRKISDSFKKPLGYTHVSDGGSPHEMRSLMDPSHVQVVNPGKLSGESLSIAGSDDMDRDSGKEMMRL